MQKIQHYDIAIIGSGITGLSTAHHLAMNKELKICVSSDQEEQSTSEISANMIAGGLIDNFTRISQRHGPEKAQAAWAYSNHAFDALLAFAKEHKIETRHGSRIRLIETEDELAECKKAVQQLKAAGFQSTVEPPPSSSAALLGQQVDESKAAYIDAKELLKFLKKSHEKHDKIGKTEKVTRESQHFTIETKTAAVTAEIVIYANHLGISGFVPGLEAVLVSSQDQWVRMRTRSGTFPFPPGSLLTWRHGHYWAHLETSQQLCIGGARFFRPLAGFEADHAELSDKISKHLPEAWAKYFPDLPLTEHVEAKAGLDIRPCDEIPVIGPMFGETGVFLAAGYMGQGLSLGFKAGQSLAKIVLGKTDELPRLFWPERHRSLATVSTEE